MMEDTFDALSRITIDPVSLTKEAPFLFLIGPTLRDVLITVYAIAIYDH